jgi:hypothetical protein
MKTYVVIEFFNPIDPDSSKPFKLTWEVLNKPYAFLWLRNLYQALKANDPSYIRFSGFTNSYKNQKWLTEKLNKAIDIINADGVYEIPEKIEGDFTQELSNVIHHHFENLIGDAKNPCERYRDSSPIGRGAICDLNRYIHDMEAYTRSLDHPQSNKVIVLEFLFPKRFKIEEDALKDFTFDFDFGDICLHYGLIGKTWLEVFLDEDEEIFPEAIRPLDVLGAEFDIQFKSEDLPKELLDKFYAWLKEQGQDQNDPKLALGFLTLARLQKEGMSDEKIIEEIGKRSGFKSIKIYDDTKEWISYDFSKSDTAVGGFSQVSELMTLGPNDQIVTKEVPIQAFVISGTEEGITLRKDLFTGPYLKNGHSITLWVPKGGKSVIIAGDDKDRCINSVQNCVLKPGDMIHLDSTPEGFYKVIKRNTTNNK